MSNSSGAFPIALSIGIMAWNEETSLPVMLDSLFRQTLFARLAERGERCEIVCLANGCTDRTVPVAEQFFRRQSEEHPDAAGFHAWVADIPEPGRNNAWNLFVHRYSASETRLICLMDADIVFHQADTLEQVFNALERNRKLLAASDWPVKDIAFKEHKSLRDRLSLATSDLTGSIPGRLNGQLYCIRTTVARNLYLARDMVANDDGFFKAIITTNFLTAPADPAKTVSIASAQHLFEPYLAISDVLNNQKRQMIGQTTVHVLVEYLKTLPEDQRLDLAETLRRHEVRDPDWLKKLIAAHVGRAGHFWKIFPDALTFRWRRWSQLPLGRRITHFPATVAGFAVTLIACYRAERFLRGGIANFWPKASRQSILAVPGVGAK
ncbi:MAG TPA: glycosyltransferase family A protein [Opitutaceae bacterium]|jgi:glycosyltransferase involved in cell wall biosynthesis